MSIKIQTVRSLNLSNAVAIVNRDIDPIQLDDFDPITPKLAPGDVILLS